MTGSQTHTLWCRVEVKPILWFVRGRESANQAEEGHAEGRPLVDQRWGWGPSELEEVRDLPGAPPFYKSFGNLRSRSSVPARPCPSASEEIAWQPASQIVRVARRVAKNRGHSRPEQARLLGSEHQHDDAIGRHRVREA
jgi:hypothetical protein